MMIMMETVLMLSYAILYNSSFSALLIGLCLGYFIYSHRLPVCTVLEDSCTVLYCGIAAQYSQCVIVVTTATIVYSPVVYRHTVPYGRGSLWSLLAYISAARSSTQCRGLFPNTINNVIVFMVFNHYFNQFSHTARVMTNKMTKTSIISITRAFSWRGS